MSEGNVFLCLYLGPVGTRYLRIPEPLLNRIWKWSLLLFTTWGGLRDESQVRASR